MRRKVIVLAIVCLLTSSFFAFFTQKAGGWGLIHGSMAEDALIALGWVETEIADVPGYADEVDLPIVGLPHPGSSNHRVEKYQEDFEWHGGDVCTFMGAESWAAKFAGEAQTAYASGDVGLGKKSLGYAIHYIQDALCPPHVFPFSEHLTDLAHSDFEVYAWTSYSPLTSDWPALVKIAQPESITSAEDLRQKVEDAADWVNATFLPPRCSYVRQDGAIIGDLSGTIVGWNMADEDIGKCIEKAAGLVKGAARWAHPHAQVHMTIYIRGDGSIDPPTAPIQRQEYLYTFTGNIFSSIVVERDNIVIDGAGYTIQGSEDPYNPQRAGIDLTGRSNVTIKNTEITAFYYAICLSLSSGNSILLNNVTNDVYGIWFDRSSNNTLTQNSIASFVDGLSFYASSNNNSIAENYIANSNYGIMLQNSNSNKILRNKLENNRGGAIQIENSTNAVVSGNNIVANYFGIALYESEYTTISSNNVVNSTEYGIWLLSWYPGPVSRYTSYNVVSGNNVVNNSYGIYLYASSLNDFHHNNFISNARQVYDWYWDHPGSPTTPFVPSINTWDDGYPSGGNYWSDYTGTDVNGDGIGDTPYVIDVDNHDNYPLMTPYPYIQGDINRDGSINNQDLILINQAYGSAPTSANWNRDADLNNDKTTDALDLRILGNNYGETVETMETNEVKKFLLSTMPLLMVLSMVGIFSGKGGAKEIQVLRSAVMRTIED